MDVDPCVLPFTHQTSYYYVLLLFTCHEKYVDPSNEFFLQTLCLQFFFCKSFVYNRTQNRTQIRIQHTYGIWVDLWAFC